MTSSELVLHHLRLWIPRSDQGTDVDALFVAESGFPETGACLFLACCHRRRVNLLSYEVKGLTKIKSHYTAATTLVTATTYFFITLHNHSPIILSNRFNMFSKATLVSLLLASSNAFVINQQTQAPSRTALNESTLNIGDSMASDIRKQVCRLGREMHNP